MNVVAYASVEVYTSFKQVLETLFQEYSDLNLEVHTDNDIEEGGFNRLFSKGFSLVVIAEYIALEERVPGIGGMLPHSKFIRLDLSVAYGNTKKSVIFNDTIEEKLNLENIEGKLTEMLSFVLQAIP